ncbi:hypothetical protein TSUD_370930 [Trifolium subterraneum]|uniref:Uncharacterized protein n=1 Tax=Trifolium subterraneum TaxID=3900 RepID=A0A2Z6MQ10_TRISU|nr:hypothetical protein TSUD_370930 [Trifolium subterraneum]
MSSLGWEVGGGAWVWRRQLWVWEEELLGECQALLHVFSLQAQYPDRWQWQLDRDRGYSVRGPLEGVYFSMKTLERQVAYKSEFSSSQHH